MSWIKERKAQSVELRRRNKLIDDEAGNVYETLWGQIAEFIKEARENSFEIVTNGSQFKRTVSRPAQPGSPLRTISIALADDKRSITARGVGAEIDIILKLDVGDDNIVFLVFGASRISAWDAAINILDPLLFPELPRKWPF